SCVQSTAGSACAPEKPIVKATFPSRVVPFFVLDWAAEAQPPLRACEQCNRGWRYTTNEHAYAKPIRPQWSPNARSLATVSRATRQCPVHRADGYHAADCCGVVCHAFCQSVESSRRLQPTRGSNLVPRGIRGSQCRG